MSTNEKTAFTFNPIAVFSEYRLKGLWSRITDRPFPKVVALLLKKEDYEYVMRISENVEADKLINKVEYGDENLRLTESLGNVSFVRDSVKIDGKPLNNFWIITVREQDFEDIDYTLFHELSHIAHGDYQRFKWLFRLQKEN